jgi:hypothetical protein
VADLTGPNPDEINGVDAHDAPITAKPTLIGGYAKAAAPTDVSLDGDAVNAWFLRNGSQVVNLASGGTLIAAAALADASANPTALSFGSDTLVFNGTTWDRVRSATADALAVTGLLASGNMVYNGTNWDRVRAVAGVTAGASTDLGIAASGIGPGFARIPANASLAASGATATISTKGAGTVTFDVTGTFTGITSIWEATTDDSVWFTVSLINLATGAQETTGPAAAAGGRWSLGEVSRYRQVRLRLTAYTTGPVVVAMTAQVGVRYVATEGDVAHDMVDQGNPLKIGGYGKATAPTAATDGDRVNAWFDLRGQLQVTLRDTAGGYVSVGGGTQYTEDAALAANAGVGTLVVARRDDVLSTLTPVADDAVGLRVGDKGALWVQISDGAGAQITSFGGGTQYAADTAIGVTPTGTLAVARASSALPTAMTADGDAVGLWASLNGALNVVMRDQTGVYAYGRLVDSGAGIYVTMPVDGSVGHDAADSGLPIKIGGYATNTVPTAVAAADRVNGWFDLNGRSVVAQKAATGTLTNVASSATTVTVLAANVARLGATIANDSTQVLYLKFGATASATSYTVKMAAGAYYEVPFGYAGVIDGIWAAANGNARVTEIT